MNTYTINKMKPGELITIIHYSGYVAIALGLFMIIPIICAILYNDSIIYLKSFVISSIISISTGLILYFSFNQKSLTNLSLKGSLIFVMGIWGVTAIFAALPYFISGDLSLIDAFFEGMSGITTTGFTMYDYYNFPYSISIWRCIIEWLGGIGIIFLLLVIVPSSTSLKRLYFAEGKTEQITPNIKHTSKIFIKVYLILTTIGIILYLLTGLDLFDSVCYTFASIGTGGYSIHPDNIQDFINPFVQFVTIILMIMGATNFIIHYRIMKRDWKNIHKDVELRALFAIIILATLIVSYSLYIHGYYNQNIPLIFRHSVFHVISVVTSTGFYSTDFTLWSPLSYHILILLMFIGGSICSTSGGIKLYNIVVLFKSIWWETQRMILPKSSVMKRKIYHDKKQIEITDQSIKNILIFILSYILLFVFSTMIILIFCNNFEVAYTLVSASIGNTGIGPAFISPDIHIIAKIVLIIDFWAGRIGIWPLLLSIVYATSIIENKIN